jgi:glycylpeptide N-tetradecanoyltransferase
MKKKTFNLNFSSFKSDCDVFNALDVMDNKEFFEKLKFGVGDGNLHYYIYNWQCPQINPEKVFFI